MRKTEIGKGKQWNQGGQELKRRFVKTPFGEIRISGFVRVPKMSASRRTWKVWMERFVEFPKRRESILREKVVEMRLKERKKK